MLQMSDSIYSREQYFIVANGSIGTHPHPIPQGTILSRGEFMRRGLTSERIGQLCAERPPILVPATHEDLARIKAVIGLTPDLEANHASTLQRRAADYAAAFERVKHSPSQVAALLLDALRDWRNAERAYLDADNNMALASGSLPEWANQVRTGFEMDRRRAELSVIEAHIRILMEPVKRGIVRLPGIQATPLQRFVASMRPVSKTPNADWAEAVMLAEMLPLKLEDAEPQGQRGIGEPDEGEKLERLFLAAYEQRGDTFDKTKALYAAELWERDWDLFRLLHNQSLIVMPDATPATAQKTRIGKMRAASLKKERESTGKWVPKKKQRKSKAQIGETKAKAADSDDEDDDDCLTPEEFNRPHHAFIRKLAAQPSATVSTRNAPEVFGMTEDQLFGAMRPLKEAGLIESNSMAIYLTDLGKHAADQLKSKDVSDGISESSSRDAKKPDPPKPKTPPTLSEPSSKLSPPAPLKVSTDPVARSTEIMTSGTPATIGVDTAQPSSHTPPTGFMVPSAPIVPLPTRTVARTSDSVQMFRPPQQPPQRAKPPVPGRPPSQYVRQPPSPPPVAVPPEAGNEPPIPDVFHIADFDVDELRYLLAIYQQNQGGRFNWRALPNELGISIHASDVRAAQLQTQGAIRVVTSDGQGDFTGPARTFLREMLTNTQAADCRYWTRPQRDFVFHAALKAGGDNNPFVHDNLNQYRGDISRRDLIQRGILEATGPNQVKTKFAPEGLRQLQEAYRNRSEGSEHRMWDRQEIAAVVKRLEHSSSLKHIEQVGKQLGKSINAWMNKPAEPKHLPEPKLAPAPGPGARSDPQPEPTYVEMDPQVHALNRIADKLDYLKPSNNPDDNPKFLSRGFSLKTIKDVFETPYKLVIAILGLLSLAGAVIAWWYGVLNPFGHL